MTGWTIQDWDTAPQTLRWAQLVNGEDFVKAVNERKTAIGQGGPLTLPIAGDSAQKAAFWRPIQQWVEDNLGSFVVSHDAGVKRDPTVDFNGESTIPVYASLAEVLSAAGLGIGAWTDGTIAADVPSRPTVFKEIQAALNVLIWTKEAYSWAWSGENNTKSGSSGWQANWAAAVAAAVAAWNASLFASDGSNPRATYTGSFEAGLYAAGIIRRYNYATISDPAGSLTKDAAWLIAANRLALGPYADNGDDVDVLENKWHCWDSSTGHAGGTITTTTALGSIAALPAECAAPVWPGTVDTELGWAGGADAVIWQYDRANGFEYY